MKNEYWKYLIWCLCSTVWATLCFALTDFIDNPISNWRTLLMVGAYILSVGIFHFLVLFVIGVNRYICAALLPIYAFIGGICSYYRLFYHVSITPLLLDAVVHTHVREAAGVISVWSILWTVFMLLVAILLCVVRFRKISLKMPVGHWLIIVGMMVGYYMAIPRLKEALDARYPMNVIYSITEYIEEKNRSAAVRQRPEIVAAIVPDSLIIVAVIGEAARADHMQLNGYERATNPKLSKLSNVVSLSDIYSMYTNTNSSVPHIITRADSINTNYSYDETSFVSVFRHLGFQCIWITNKNQNKPFMDFMHESDTVLYTSAARTQSLYAKWLDEELIPIMKEHVEQSQKQLFVLHTMGSHWLYDTHVTDELSMFQPVITNRDIRQNTIEQITNSYDNTILYLDYFLDSVVACLFDRPAIVLYLSDHGESLGEGGRYLHSQPNAEEEKFPAAIVWYSNKYATLFPEKVEALHKNSQRHYHTDYFFYSILYAAGIEAEGDNPDVNIFKTSTP